MRFSLDETATRQRKNAEGQTATPPLASANSDENLVGLPQPWVGAEGVAGLSAFPVIAPAFPPPGKGLLQKYLSDIQKSFRLFATEFPMDTAEKIMWLAGGGMLSSSVFAVIFGVVFLRRSETIKRQVEAIFEERAERVRWPKEREDALAKELRAAVLNFSLKMSAATHSMTWLTWRAGARAAAITNEVLNAYDGEMHKVLPDLTGYLASVGALDRMAFEQLRPVANKIYLLDSRIGDAIILFAESPDVTTHKLGSLFADALELEKTLPEMIADIINVRITARADALDAALRVSPPQG